MGIDFSRVATSALQAALEDGQQPEAKQHHRRLTAGKAIVAGAAVAVAREVRRRQGVAPQAQGRDGRRAPHPPQHVRRRHPGIAA